MEDESRDVFLFKILCIAAKKALTRNLLRSEPSEPRQWLDIVEEIYVPWEKMTFFPENSRSICS